MRIYKRTDRIPVKIGELTVKIAPLSLEQKAEVSTKLISGRVKGESKDLLHATMLAIKYAVKSIDGLTDGDDKPYQLQFDGELLTDECASELMNMSISGKVQSVCLALINNIPDEFTDFVTGQKLDGVEILKKESASKNA